MGRPPTLLRRDKQHQPVAVKQLADSLPRMAWKSVCWREGTKQKLRSCFAALRVRVAHRDYWRRKLPAEEWLLIELPSEESEPTKYWLATLSADSKLAELVTLAKQRWIIERDYEELKQELGLGHTMKVAVGEDFIIMPPYASRPKASWLPKEAVFSRSARAGKLDLRAPRIPPDFLPRGTPRTRRAA